MRQPILGRSVSDVVAYLQPRIQETTDLPDLVGLMFDCLLESVPKKGRQAVYEDARRSQGLCVKCSAKVWRFGSRYCLSHHEADKARKRRKS